MHLQPVEQPRRTERRLERAHTSGLHGEREQQVGIAQHLVIDEVARLVVECVDIERPSANGNAEADFPNLIAFAGNRQEVESLAKRK
jgi:hypothetical protein